MTRKRIRQEFTPLELEIMNVLWAHGPANVAAVQEALPGKPPLAYTTVQTMLNILHRKGKVKRTLKGRAYEYAPVVSRERAARAAVRDMINRLFGGSAESLVMSLIEQRHMTPEKLADLNRLVAELKEDDHGGA
ncbi:MAG TPA: BlaI/MecI/CopY family transcriptional regulator [Terriglobia bacterium]